MSGQLGATATHIYLVDHEQRELLPRRARRPGPAGHRRHAGRPGLRHDAPVRRGGRARGEARSADGEAFGVDRLVDCAVRALADDLPLPETARRLVHAILSYQEAQLRDDATVLLVRRHGPSGERSH